MTSPFLLSRVLLRFATDDSDLLEDISAAAFTPDGSLWVGSDELTTLERLSPLEPMVFGDHQSFNLGDFLALPDPEGEIDIEGMDYSAGYLWVTGSHSTKRKRPKGKKPDKDLERLKTVKSEVNRYLLGRVPVINGKLVKSVEDPQESSHQLTAAQLAVGDASNALMEALKTDEHLGTYVSSGLPSKENGFDIEGLAVKGDRVFLGLRGPVLRGWAVILEIEVTAEGDTLILQPIGDGGELYRKHLLDLSGLGIRELCFDGDDLIVLGGPTMTLDATIRTFRWRNALDRDENSLVYQDSKHLHRMFDLPLLPGEDRAEGLALYSCLGGAQGLLVVYDTLSPKRRLGSGEILVDVFRLTEGDRS